VIRVIDDLGRELAFAALPRRVVSLVPSLTESICALGGGDLLAAVTRHCVEPAAELEGISRVGGTKNPDIKCIAALSPDLVIVNAEENRKEDFDALERGGWPLFVSFPRTVEQVPDLLRRLGVLLGLTPAAEAAVLLLRRALVEARTDPAEARVAVFCPIWKNPWMTFNGDTFAADMLCAAGGRNVFADKPDRYPQISLDAVAQANPEVILLPDEPYVFGRKDLAALAPLQGTAALANGRVHFVDGKALFWFGTRSAAALDYLRRIIRA
jgi:ABC-type Fe3+-hydroxamate transport system substrate-binding protein